jgi:hypothetical protein
MPLPRRIAIAVLGLRIAYGLGLVVAPGRLTETWLGPSGRSGPTQAAVRGIGAREVLLHVGALGAALRSAPLRPWLAASIVGDVADMASTVAARAELPDVSPRATLAVAGGSAAISAALATAVDG